MTRWPGYFLALYVLAFSAFAASMSAPTFQELMTPEWFPESQRGMEVESVSVDDDVACFRTTGAIVRIHQASGDIQFEQRIGRQRPMATLRLGAPLIGLRATRQQSGCAFFTCESPAVSMRINGDSLFMLHVHAPLSVSVESRIQTGWQASFKSNHLLADEWGGFGLYVSMPDVQDNYDPYGDVVAAYPLAADAVLWLGVCPPKAYEWDQSLNSQVVWHWSNTLGYPPDEVLESWQEHGNIVLLQSEVMLWKDWNLDFLPRLGAEEFARVRKTAHGLNMRFIVYTSPYYFLRGTPLESAAFNSFEGFSNWPPGTPTGENMTLFLEAIRRVMREHQPDGLYFDGQYLENPAALYALARNARSIVGESGILEWHSTHALGYEGCYLPQADAYVDFVLRGEGVEQLYEDRDYLRYFVSGYNLHNSIGVLCNNGGAAPTAELADRVLAVNARLHAIAGWLHNPQIVKVLQDQYRLALHSDLKEKVHEQLEMHQAQIPAKAASGRAERDALNAPPDWSAPILACVFPPLPDATAFHAPDTAFPFAVVENTLQVAARGHAHAYYQYDVNRSVSGMLVKLRQGTDGGMSWGPAAALRFPDGAVLRVGLRCDGLIQSDILGRQLLHPGHPADAWVWLRVRWRERRGVLESSLDGQHFATLTLFEHGGQFTKTPTALLVGKVPYDGAPRDYQETGALGACQFALVELYP